MATVTTEARRAVQPRGAAVAKPYDEKLRTAVEVRIDLLGLKQAEAAKQMGLHETALNKFLRKVPAGDVVSQEAVIRDWLANTFREENAPKYEKRFIHMDAADVIFGALDTIRETRDFGIISGPAGCGKTQAEIEYIRRNPSAIRIEVTDDNSSRAGVARLLMRQIGIRQSTRDALLGEGVDNIPAMEMIREELRGSGRLIIFDQEIGELTDSGLKAVFDLHNTAGIPIAVLGNESMIEDIKGRKSRQIKRNERRASRVGFKLELQPYDDKRVFQFFDDAQLKQFLNLYVHDFGEEFFKECRRIARWPSYLRTLHKHLLLFMRVQDGFKGPDVECLRLCGQSLLTDTGLEG